MWIIPWDPFLIKKVTEKGLKSQIVLLLFMNSAWTVAVCLLRRVPKKKGKTQDSKCQTPDVYPNPHLFSSIKKNNDPLKNKFALRYMSFHHMCVCVIRERSKFLHSNLMESSSYVLLGNWKVSPCEHLVTWLSKSCDLFELFDKSCNVES